MARKTPPFWHWLLALGLPLILLIGQASWFQSRTSVTYDEGLYLEFSRRAFRDGDFRLFLEYGCAPLPILIAYAHPCLTVPQRGPETVPLRIGRARRAHLLLVAAPLLLLAGGWVGRRRGPLAGGLCAGLLALSPAFVAHASLATTDATMALTFLLGLLGLERYRERPDWAGFGWLTLGLGLALAAKFTTFVLLAFPLWLFARGEAAGRWRRWLGRWCALAAGTLLLVWALHGFDTVPALKPGQTSVWARDLLGEGPWATRLITALEATPAPAPVMGVLYQTSHVRFGQLSFLDGERREKGWFRYYPLVFLYKGTPAEWLLLLLLLPAGWAAWRPADASRAWLLSLLLYVGFLISQTVALGQRLLLIAHVLLAMIVIDWLTSPTRGRWRGAGLAAAAIALAMQAGALSTVAPRYLSYFSPAVGGSANGYRHLVDSNLDWGQDLPTLAAWWRAKGQPTMALAHFGDLPIPDTVDHALIPREPYGVRAGHPIWSPERVVAGCEWLVVSASELQGVSLAGDPFAPLRAVEPDERIAATLFAYRMQRPEVRAAVAAARRRGR